MQPKLKPCPSCNTTPCTTDCPRKKLKDIANELASLSKDKSSLLCACILALAEEAQILSEYSNTLPPRAIAEQAKTLTEFSGALKSFLAPEALEAQKENALQTITVHAEKLLAHDRPYFRFIHDLDYLSYKLIAIGTIIISLISLAIKFHLLPAPMVAPMLLVLRTLTALITIALIPAIVGLRPRPAIAGKKAKKLCHTLMSPKENQETGRIDNMRPTINAM